MGPRPAVAMAARLPARPPAIAVIGDGALEMTGRARHAARPTPAGSGSGPPGPLARLHRAEAGPGRLVLGPAWGARRDGLRRVAHGLRRAGVGAVSTEEDLARRACAEGAGGGHGFGVIAAQVGVEGYRGAFLAPPHSKTPRPATPARRSAGTCEDDADRSPGRPRSRNSRVRNGSFAVSCGAGDGARRAPSGEPRPSPRAHQQGPRSDHAPVTCRGRRIFERTKQPGSSEVDAGRTRLPMASAKSDGLGSPRAR